MHYLPFVLQKMIFSFSLFCYNKVEILQIYIYIFFFFCPKLDLFYWLLSIFICQLAFYMDDYVASDLIYLSTICPSSCLSSHCKIRTIDLRFFTALSFCPSLTQMIYKNEIHVNETLRIDEIVRRK